MVLEICANSVTSAIIAQAGGADRIELCANLKEGGTTPSYGEILTARRQLHIPLYIIIRPRSGDFLYSPIEFEVMKQDVQIAKALNAEGVVFGILDQDGNVDKIRNKELLEIAKPLSSTFHRAFDMCSNLPVALEDIILLGFERILTSGGKQNALLGAAVIKKLVQQAEGRIAIMPGSGINEQNILDIARATGAVEFHTTAKEFVESRMKFQNGNVTTGTDQDEYLTEQTSLDKVRNLAGLLKLYH